MRSTVKVMSLMICGLAAGCSSEPSTSPLDSPTYAAALEKQKHAVETVKVYQAVPSNSLAVRMVMSATCGSDSVLTGADESYVLTGLKVKAFSSGADAIAEVVIKQLPDPGRHCEGNVAIGGTAKAFSVQH